MSGPARGKTYVVRGFWDGENVWKIRFAPTAAGSWSYETYSADRGLDAIAGRLTALAPTRADLAANVLYHGFLERDGHAWRLTDGTPFLPVGDSQFSFSEEFTFEEWKQWIDVLRDHGFNSFHGCVWLGKYDRAGIAPFQDRDPKTDQLNLEFFRRLDRMVEHANGRGILMGLFLGGFPENTRWYELFGTRERNNRWLRYAVGRYAAYNVRWGLYGEVNEKAPPWGGTWQEAAAHSARLVKEADPYRHPLGSHHTSVDTSTAGSPDIDYIEVQAKRTETQYETALACRQWGKPVWFEEYWYEPPEYDNDVVLGIRNTHRNFVAAMALPTIGSLMRAHASSVSFPPARALASGKSLAEYLKEQDGGIRRMKYFADFYRGLDLAAFSPAPQLVDRGQCGRFGATYAVFLAGGGGMTLDLTQASGDFTARALDITTGSVRDLGAVAGGTPQRIDTGAAGDVAVVVSPAAPRPRSARVAAPVVFHR